MIQIDFPKFDFKFKTVGNSPFIFDLIRRKYVALTPEEWVRQNLLHYFIDEMRYPKGLISVEKEIEVNMLKKRYDIVIYDHGQSPWMLVECKEPNVDISDEVLRQVIIYNQALQCPFWLLSNGQKTFCAQVGMNGEPQWLSALPVYNP